MNKRLAIHCLGAFSVTLAGVELSGFESDKAQLERAHAESLAELRAEKQEVETGLASAREEIADLQEEIQRAIAGRDAAVSQRDQQIEELEGAVAARDKRLASLRAEIEELEGENAQFQEEVLKAYRKINADEATVSRAKKALAIALTLLDDTAKRDGSEDAAVVAAADEEESAAVAQVVNDE